ncbi:hypothetical protein OG413_09785 [Streptomyces sp. NBC_01433]|uniref:hypothetical protein n=1 Tax=Streptomyces sp. NBC_01433 TaxID=2903864 RepID=UPI002259DCC8|nr:hypothetical protein [Streptomyces sp. NBC_01433]MCX4675595.1 hypothetical protein [Streptomyces sp. NBC_01433]
MKPHHMTRLLSAGLASAVLTLGAVLGWPIWVWFLLPAIGAGALLIDMRVSSAVREGGSAWPEDEEEEAGGFPEPPAESPYLETSVVVVPVRSALEDCPFLFSATVCWRAAGRNTSAHGNPGALAATAVLERVQRVTEVEHPSRCTFLEQWLEGVLGTPLVDDSALVTAFATDIRLVLRQADREHLEELDGLRKAMGAWESRSQHERNLREYLGGEVLQSPGSAVVWWLARHEDQIERAVEMIAPLTVLSAAANDEVVPEEFRDLLTVRGASFVDEPMSGFDHPEPVDENAVPEAGGDGQRAGRQESPGERVSALLDDLGMAPDSAERAAFTHRLARMFEGVGRSEAAESVRADVRRGAAWYEQVGRPAEAAYEDGAAVSDGPDIHRQPTYPGADPGFFAADTFRSEGTDAVSGGGWQVTPSGTVSAADVPEQPRPGGWNQGGSDSGSEGVGR